MKSGVLASLFCSFLAACSSSDDKGTRSHPLDLAPPETGFQIEGKGTTIAGGQDVEYCEVVQLPGGPGDVYYTNHFEAALTPFSPHLNVYAVDPSHPVNA
ncbi:MAG TPA: hypothetical protein VK524_09220, partial [Polyangiaceae bacterium]|nr:hypothetical protein [Polyangiaceae bacterium]